MISQNIVLSAPSGIHARPAGELVKLVKSLAPTKITISNGIKTVNAASMLSILSLGLKCGSSIEICADGESETDALANVVEFIQSITE